MVEDHNKIIQPKSVDIRKRDPVENVQVELGGIDFNRTWGNNYAQWEGITKLAEEYLDDIHKKKTGRKTVYTYPDDFDLDRFEQLLRALITIWYDGAYIVRHVDPNNPVGFLPNETYFVTNMRNFKSNNPKLQYIIKLPSLYAMKPLEDVMMPKWGYKIRTVVPNFFAYDGYGYDEVITNTNQFYLEFREGKQIQIPKLSVEDFRSMHAYTDRVSKNFYDKVMTYFRRYFHLFWSECSNLSQQLIMSSEKDNDGSPPQMTLFNERLPVYEEDVTES